VILYLDGEACPGLVYHHGKLLTNTNETGRGVPVACERCFSWEHRVESAKRIHEEDRKRADEWEAKQRAETQPPPPDRISDGNGTHPSFPARTPDGCAPLTVKQILKEDGESVVALFREVVEVVDRGRSLYRKFFPKD
jgi:hypothetical protein